MKEDLDMAEKNKKKVFENLVTTFTENFSELSELLLEAEEKKSGVPERLVILAKGFANKWDSKKVNEELLSRDCGTLYARSFYEAGLIYAYDHGMGYEDWKVFNNKFAEIMDGENSITEKYFTGGKITLKQLEKYVYAESDEDLQTELLTRWMEKEIKEKDTEEKYQDFVKENIENFSAVRERARYYFCKYLYLYIREKCENYYESCKKSDELRLTYESEVDVYGRSHMEKFALEELSFLKPLTVLKRDAEKLKKRMTFEEKKEYLENTALTPGGIFDDFNYFYFGYVSTGWMEVLFELYGEFCDWPDETKVRVAHSLGLCERNPSPDKLKKALEKLEVMEREQREKEELLDQDGERKEELKRKMYQRGRSGEDFFREFITGNRDINRETLISFLLFVKMRVSLDEDNKITLMRLNGILRNCGFAQLRPNQEFDKFVMEFLRSRDPMELLEEVVVDQVEQGKDSYLYKVYRDAYCHQKELLTYLC